MTGKIFYGVQSGLAFESERNPLMQQDCHEREWLGGYLVPIFQDKSILEERVDHGHLTVLLCSTDSYEMLCLLACGDPHKQYKSEVHVYLMERHDVYQLHLIIIKTFDIPLTFTTFHILRISLGWAWIFGLQGLVNNLLEKLIDNAEMGLVTPQWISMDFK
ncbi:15496_t:CDS:2 [Entrophospora sp. SA101]|nr:15496_t:CDS:2 [Entrophospora sp. SA101]